MFQVKGSLQTFAIEIKLLLQIQNSVNSHKMHSRLAEGRHTQEGWCVVSARSYESKELISQIKIKIKEAFDVLIFKGQGGIGIRQHTVLQLCS